MKYIQQTVHSALKGLKSNPLSLATFKPGKDLKSDHKGFTDQAFVTRRDEIAQLSQQYTIDSEYIPTIPYTEKEHKTWQVVFDLLKPLHDQYACKEHKKNLEELQKLGLITRKKLPQLQPISEFIQSKTGFKLIPVSGMLKQRDFFNLLANKMFPATQFIRHHSDPFYAPEPDVVHEIMGHMPLLANQDYADFFHFIGKASIGKNDFFIKQLGNCYLFTAEFGLVKENNKFKVYGAGILSSGKEICNAFNGDVKIRAFEPRVACETECPLSDLQEVYFWSNSLLEVKENMKKFV